MNHTCHTCQDVPMLLKHVVSCSLLGSLCSFVKVSHLHFHKYICSLTQRSISFCLRPATLLKNGLWHRCFPLNFVKFLKTPFL